MSRCVTLGEYGRCVRPAWPHPDSHDVFDVHEVFDVHGVRSQPWQKEDAHDFTRSATRASSASSSFGTAL